MTFVQVIVIVFLELLIISHMIWSVFNEKLNFLLVYWIKADLFTTHRSNIFEKQL